MADKEPKALQLLDDFQLRAVVTDGDDEEAWTPKTLELRLWGGLNFAALDLIDGQTGFARYSVTVQFKKGQPVISVSECDEDGKDVKELVGIVCE